MAGHIGYDTYLCALVHIRIGLYANTGSDTESHPDAQSTANGHADDHTDDHALEIAIRRKCIVRSQSSVHA